LSLLQTGVVNKIIEEAQEGDHPREVVHIKKNDGPYPALAG
jgi:hypothetical protein